MVKVCPVPSNILTKWYDQLVDSRKVGDPRKKFSNLSKSAMEIQEDMSNVCKSERRGIAGNEEIKDNRIKDNRNL